MSKIVFEYHGVNGQGTEVRGTVEAADKQDALTKLRLLEAQGLRDLSIESATTEAQEVIKPVAKIKMVVLIGVMIVCIGIMTWSQIVTPPPPTPSALSIKSSENNLRNDPLEYKLASIDAGVYISKDHITVARFRSLLEQLSSKFVENKEQIANMTAAARQMLRDKDGVEESLLNILEGMNQLSAGIIKNQKYSECIATYTMLRSKGQSHSDSISGLREILRALGVR